MTNWVACMDVRYLQALKHIYASVTVNILACMLSRGIVGPQSNTVSSAFWLQTDVSESWNHRHAVLFLVFCASGRCVRCMHGEWDLLQQKHSNIRCFYEGMCNWIKWTALHITVVIYCICGMHTVLLYLLYVWNTQVHIYTHGK